MGEDKNDNFPGESKGAFSGTMEEFPDSIQKAMGELLNLGEEGIVDPQTVLTVLRYILDQQDRIKHLSGEARKVLIDPLTDLGSRLALDLKMKEEINLHSRIGHSVSLLFCDINEFKKVNDTLGHQKGDELLKLIAELMKKQGRKIDLIARWGGDEIAVVLPFTDAEKALEVGERFLKEIYQGLMKSKFKDVVEGMKDFGVSIGVAQLRDDEDETSWLRRADEAMYAAKDQYKGDKGGRQARKERRWQDFGSIGGEETNG